MNFLCDEAGNCGKEVNIVVSQLHYRYCFDNHGLGEILRFLIHISQTVTKVKIIMLFTGEKTVCIFMPTTVHGYNTCYQPPH